MNIYRVYLKGPWAPGNTDMDIGLSPLRLKTDTTMTLMDNEYGLNSRSYPIENIARIELRDNWDR